MKEASTERALALAFLLRPVFLCTDAHGSALEPLHTSHPFVQSRRVIFFGFNELLWRVPATVVGNFFATSSDFTFSKLTWP